MFGLANRASEKRAALAHFQVERPMDLYRRVQLLYPIIFEHTSYTGLRDPDENCYPTATFKTQGGGLYRAIIDRLYMSSRVLVMECRGHMTSLRAPSPLEYNVFGMQTGGILLDSLMVLRPAPIDH